MEPEQEPMANEANAADKFALISATCHKLRSFSSWMLAAERQIDCARQAADSRKYELAAYMYTSAKEVCLHAEGLARGLQELTGRADYVEWSQDLQAAIAAENATMPHGGKGGAE